MEPDERKDVTVARATKEPLKMAGLVPSPDTSETRNECETSPPPDCSICLEKLRNTSFTDSCLHQFCFTCLLEWSKKKSECPLCRQTFKSIIHNVKSKEEYDQYHVPRELAAQLPTQHIARNGQENHMPPALAAVLGTSVTPNRRYDILNSHQVARRDQIPIMFSPVVPQEAPRFHNVNLPAYWSFGQLGGSSGAFIRGLLGGATHEFFRINSHELNGLKPWIKRELHILFNGNESRIADVLNVITDALLRVDLCDFEFLNIVRPYLQPHASRFVKGLIDHVSSRLARRYL